MNEDIMEIMLDLYPPLYTRYANSQMNRIIEIAMVVTVDNGLTGATANLGLALMTLDILSTPDRSNITSKRIKGVEIEFSDSKASYSNWKAMYDSLVNGTVNDELKLFYVGI